MESLEHDEAEIRGLLLKRLLSRWRTFLLIYGMGALLYVYIAEHRLSRWDWLDALRVLGVYSLRVFVCFGAVLGLVLIFFHFFLRKVLRGREQIKDLIKTKGI